MRTDGSGWVLNTSKECAPPEAADCSRNGAAIAEGVPYANGAPNLSADFPAMYAFANEMGVPVCGKDVAGDRRVGCKSQIPTGNSQEFGQSCIDELSINWAS